MSSGSHCSPLTVAETSSKQGSDVILVVEDDAALLKLIEKRLAAAGYETVGATEGASALAWLERKLPALMLLDYSLPDMHGEHLLECLDERGLFIPFVVATGHGSESVAVEMMKRGAYDYLVKGASFMKLLPAVVEQALERARQAERLDRAEAELRSARDELELRVEQRTAELAEANRRLREEMEVRRRAEEQLQWHQAELAHVARLSTAGEMAAELAHELNQPLSAISSHAQACRRFLISGVSGRIEDFASSLNQVGEQADRAAEIIRRLRRFVRKAKPTQSLVNVNDLVRDVAELTNVNARMAEAEVALELAQALPPVLGDRIQLEQVLVNLMQNGFEALRESECRPRRLTVRTAADGPLNVAVEVSDNGVGFPPDISDRIFDRFFSTKPEGMGMGLSIGRSIAHNHGGRLWATANADRGSTFHFILPIDQGDCHRGK